MKKEKKERQKKARKKEKKKKKRKEKKRKKAVALHLLWALVAGPEISRAWPELAAVEWGTQCPQLSVKAVEMASALAWVFR